MKRRRAREEPIYRAPARRFGVSSAVRACKALARCSSVGLAAFLFRRASRRAGVCAGMRMHARALRASSLPNDARPHAEAPRSIAAAPALVEMSFVERHQPAIAPTASGQQHQPGQCALSTGCAHHARRRRKCDETAALGPGAAIHRTCSTPSAEDKRSELRRRRA